MYMQQYVNLRVPKDIHTKLKAQAESRDLSMTELLRQLVAILDEGEPKMEQPNTTDPRSDYFGISPAAIHHDPHSDYEGMAVPNFDDL
jgi:hypothetical protein